MIDCVTTMVALKEKVLTQSAGEVILHLIAGFFGEAEDALARLQVDGDEEALHDFRVAVRRLRSTERAYRGCLGGGALRKFRKRVARAAQATGYARDLDVHLAWLEHERAVIRAHEQPGYDWLLQRLTAARQAERKRLHKKLGKHFGRLAGPYAKLKPADKPAAAMPFHAAAAQRIQQASDVLSRALRELPVEHDEARVHQIRIDAKRLRYLVEPLRAPLVSAQTVVGTLKGLQDLLGEVHDRQTLLAMLREAAEQAGAEHFRRLIDLSASTGLEDPAYLEARERDERAGLVRLAREAREQQEDLLLKLRAQLDSGLIEQLEGHTGDLLDALDARA